MTSKPKPKDPAAVSLGRRGGLAGRGAAKRRTREQAQAAGRLGGLAGKGVSKTRKPKDPPAG
jgi:hypothetical protein